MTRDQDGAFKYSPESQFDDKCKTCLDHQQQQQQCQTKKKILFVRCTFLL